MELDAKNWSLPVKIQFIIVLYQTSTSQNRALAYLTLNSCTFEKQDYFTRYEHTADRPTYLPQHWSMKSKAVQFMVLFTILSNLAYGCETDGDCVSPCQCRSYSSSGHRFCTDLSIYNSRRNSCATCFPTSSCDCTTGSLRPVCVNCEIDAFDSSERFCGQPDIVYLPSTPEPPSQPLLPSSLAPPPRPASSNPTPRAALPLPKASKNNRKRKSENKKAGAGGGGVGKIIGIAVGSVIGAVLVVVLGLFGARKWKTRNRVF